MLNSTIPIAHSTNRSDHQTHPCPPPVNKSPVQQHQEPETTSTRSATADLDMQSSQEIDRDINWREVAVEAVPPRPPDCPGPPSNDPPSLDPGTEFLKSCVPSFLKPPASCLNEQDLDYLSLKGALSIPEPELRDALIESYVFYIHPCYPLVDLGALEAAMQGNSGEPFSLSVFQAIMFAGAAWVDIKMLRKLGYLSRWAARKTFYSKARLLYDTDYEQDRLCQLQTLVLMSLWWKAPNETKDGWHWLGLAISLARTMGLHQDITNKHLDKKTSTLRRRIWWSCTIRDTFTSFSANRVPRISDGDFAVAPLTLDDFDWYEGRDDTRTGIGKQSLSVQKQLAAMCIQTAALCRIITRVLLAAYSVTSTGDIDILYFNSTPEQGRLMIQPTILRNIEEEFRAWYTNIPSDVAHCSPIFASSLRHEQAPLVHRALLSILYYTGLIMIHRQRDPSSPAEESPRNLVRDAASQVNRIIIDIYAVDLMKDMSPTVISLLFPTSMSHMLDMKSRDAIIRRSGAQKLQECKRAIRELVDGHFAAEWAVNFLNCVESKVNSQAPIVNAGTRTAFSRQKMGEQRQDHGEERVASQAYSPTLSASNPAFSLDTLSPNFVPGLSGSTAEDDPVDWFDMPNVYFGFPDTQWDGSGLARLENDRMLMDFGIGSFRDYQV
ncbi:hypothetical protein LTR84_006518 [Exophiala bonariae]|uniref:Xylanolytic transcriptional activator regulatory domain-containing protein n=1 Tax=Exophiala bonariae TaxID=1690606 RepID=A0AAV9N3Q9_9EURO|nr:hypothetical protein LTR84_006518 [Exophiala bonariae]